MKLPVKFPVLCTEPNVFRSGIWLLAEKQAILPNSLARHYRVIKDQYILALDSGQATAPTLHCYPLHPTNRMPAPKLLDRRPDTDPVLTEPLADALRPHLPVRIRLASSWTLLYSLDQHGISLSTLYQKVKGKGPCILAVKDANDEIFGGYLNEPLKPSPSYYGTGECFLWRAMDISNKTSATVRVYPWSGKNEYMVLSETDFVAIGGGDGKFGLWLHSDLERGHTDQCPTFDNEPLASSRKFECVELEIWGFKQ